MACWLPKWYPGTSTENPEKLPGKLSIATAGALAFSVLLTRSMLTDCFMSG
jgi:hypothetical protein